MMPRGGEVELQTNNVMTHGTSSKVDDDVAEEDTCHLLAMSLMTWQMLTWTAR